MTSSCSSLPGSDSDSEDIELVFDVQLCNYDAMLACNLIMCTTTTLSACQTVSLSLCLIHYRL
jgi:hypothetical protein